MVVRVAFVVFEAVVLSGTALAADGLREALGACADSDSRKALVLMWLTDSKKLESEPEAGKLFEVVLTGQYSETVGLWPTPVNQRRELQ